MKLKNIYLFAILFLGALTSCQSGIVYDEYLEDVYMDVEVDGGMVRNRPREHFVNKVWQVNYNNRKGCWLENYMARSLIDAFENGFNYKNETNAPVDILGTKLAPGETMLVKNTKEVVDDASAPEGKKYILHMFTFDKVTYHTPNKGHLFVKSAFEGADYKPVAYYDEQKPGMFRYAVCPVRIDKMVLELILKEPRACKVEPVNGAPKLGIPADYSKPQQYMVINYAYRPKGAPEAKRLYEIRVHVLPVTADVAYAKRNCQL